MPKKEMKSALTSSIKAEEESFQSRFDKADAILDSQESPGGQKKQKPKSHKTIRDSFTIPDFDYQMIAALQERLLKLGFNVSKSEVVRAGFHSLEKLSDEEILFIFQSLEKVKTGRPKKE